MKATDTAVRSESGRMQENFPEVSGFSLTLGTEYAIIS